MGQETAKRIATIPGTEDTPPAADDLRCPLCRYDLRGQCDPRCPECGYRFTWNELTDPTLRLHPYLFEHHPERNTSSFVQTVLGGLLPRRFWRGVFPTQPSRPRRLLVYWLLAALPLIGVIVGVSAHRARAGWKQMANYRAMMLQRVPTNTFYRDELTRTSGSVQNYFDIYAPPPGSIRFYQLLLKNAFWRNSRPFDKFVVALLLWPWLTALALMVFRISMRRARIRPVHVMRCVLYGADVLFWPGLVLAVVVTLQLYGGRDMIQGPFPDIVGRGSFLYLPGDPDWATTLAYLGAYVTVIAITYRLTVAYRHYLRFDRPVATILASQAIVFLLVLVVMINWGVTL